MSIWGRVIGGVAGYALGGPLGALLGIVAGRAVDKMREAEAANNSNYSAFNDFDQSARQQVFTAGVITLAAKMAKADGRISADEISAFKTIMHIPKEEMAQVSRIWNEAKNERGGYEPYAQQIGQLFKQEPVVLEEILGALFYIAKADGTIHKAEIEMLTNTAILFGFDAQNFERLRRIHLNPGEEEDAYGILGVKRTDTEEEIKRSYKKLIRENHPDVLIAKGVPQEFIDLANEKMATINAAYDRIEKERGFK